jgi:threonine/homoserine efflux transporter RhtA
LKERVCFFLLKKAHIYPCLLQVIARCASRGYVSDQLAMARLERSTFALLLSLLPASAAIIGIIVLRQIPQLPEVAGILLVAGGVALHKEAEARSKNRAKSTDGKMNELEHLEAARSVHRD